MPPRRRPEPHQGEVAYLTMVNLPYLTMVNSPASPWSGFHLDSGEDFTLIPVGLIPEIDPHLAIERTPCLLQTEVVVEVFIRKVAALD